MLILSSCTLTNCIQNILLCGRFHIGRLHSLLDSSDLLHNPVDTGLLISHSFVVAASFFRVIVLDCITKVIVFLFHGCQDSRA